MPRSIFNVRWTVDTTPEEQAQLRKAGLVAAAVVLVYLALDLFFIGSNRALIAFRLIWAGTLCGLTYLQPEGERAKGAVNAALGLSTAACFTGVCWSTGGTASTYFPYMLALPLAFAALLPHRPLATLSNGAGLTVGAALLMLLGSATVMTDVLLIAMQLSSLGLALYSIATYQRWRLAEGERTAALTRLSESERQRAQAERLAVVGRLAAGVAHEINNPLAYVVSNVEWITTVAQEGSCEANSEELAEVLQETRLGLTRIRNIVADLRAFSRESPDASTPCNLGDAITEALRQTDARLSPLATVETLLPHPLPHVGMGASRLVQVLVNLLVNAGDAVSEARPQGERGRVRLSVHAGADFAQVVVEDDGRGISAEAMARLFEPFFTTKPVGKGTGLGLALSKQYVERYGGTLEAGNRAEGGARFTLKLPRAAAPANPVEEVTPAPKRFPHLVPRRAAA